MVYSGISGLTAVGFGILGPVIRTRPDNRDMRPFYPGTYLWAE